MHDDEKPMISASILAQLGACEKKAHLSFIHGNRFSEFQQKLMRKGTIAHEENRKNVLSGKENDKRCFIASEVYGPDAEQTHYLRAFRDQRLLPNPLGKIFVTFYYRYSPLVVKVTRKYSLLRNLIKSSLDYFLSRRMF